MKTLGAGIERGGLVELSGADKTSALSVLADAAAQASGLPADELRRLILERETQAVTSLGHGWAVPHARTAEVGELTAVLGWSRDGLDYGAADGAKIHMVALFVIPPSAGREYLTELGELARAIQADDVLRHPWRFTSREQVRAAIRLPAGPQPASAAIPFRVVWAPGVSPLVLSPDAALVEHLEQAGGLDRLCEASGSVVIGRYRLDLDDVNVFAGKRVMVTGSARQGNA